jgi:hypothetical protein
MFEALKQLCSKSTTCCVRPSEEDDEGSARISSNRRSWRSSVSLPKRQSRGPFPVQVERLDEMVEKIKVQPGMAAERAVVVSAPPTRSDDEPTALRQPGQRKPSMSSSMRKPSIVGAQLRHRSSASTVISAVSAKLAAAISAGERGSKMHSRSSSRSSAVAGKLHSRTGSMATKRGHRRNDSCTSVLGEEYAPPPLPLFFLPPDE